MLIKLVRKLANRLNGIDLTNVSVGDVVDVTDRQASLLIAEGWAQPVASVTRTDSAT